MKTYANFKKKKLIRVFWFEYISPIIFIIRILDQMLLQKNSVPFKGLHYCSLFSRSRVEGGVEGGVEGWVKR